MHLRSKILRRLLPLLWFAPGLWAQALPLPAPPPAASQAPVEPNGDIPVFRSDTRRVLLYVSVVDKNGKMITDIPQSAFKVTENGVEQQIRYFRREDVPVSLGLIVDNSGSMRDKRARVNAAAMALVKASNPQDEVFVFNFNDDVFLDQEFTNNERKMEDALEKIDARGGTALRNAVSLGIDYAKEKGRKVKKVLVVVTDGADTSSNETTLEQLVRKAQRSEVLIYAIGILDKDKDEPRDIRSAKRALKALAEASGGLDYYPKDLAEVEEITPEIAHEIRNQYIIEYAPSNQALDGTFRQVKVTVGGVRGATVRTRNGYYATPEDEVQPRPLSAK